MRAVAPVHVMLLGPPRVERDGVAVAFDTRKALALLAVLALADRPRPRDVLAELLWPEHDSEHARGALRRTLSALRSGVGPDVVEATRDRVSLVRAPGLTVDVDVFRSAAAAGDPGAAAAAFRGEFLEGFGLRDAPGFEDWQRSEADGLARELAAVLARLVEASGDVAVAQRWLELDPLHEPAHRALIRLYAERGDRAAALAQYRECVRTLSRELGVPPLAETTRLYEAISEGTLETPATDGPGAPAPAAPPPRAPLVGRDREWAALLGAYDGIAGDGGAVLLEGEAGIGKTRLAEELVAYVREQGAAVLAGRAYEEEAALAYGPVVEALRRRLRDDDSWVAGVGDRALCEAARLLPDLSAAPPPPLDGPAAQARFLDGVWETLAAAAAGPVPGLLVIDDVQWADEATFGLLTYGLRRLGGRRLLVLLTSRAPLRRAPATVIGLDRLGEDEVGELLRATVPDPAPELARRLYEETEGLPFLLVEYLNSLGADPDWALPQGARELLLARLDPVSETGRQVLATAAVIGRSFEVDTVRAASGRGDEETVAALEELVQRGLIREGRFDYDFAHEQLRRLVAEETSLARRRLLHGRAADALLGARPLEGLGGAGPARARDSPTGGLVGSSDPFGGRFAEVARHLRLAGRDAEAAAAYRARRRARTLAVRQHGRARASARGARGRRPGAGARCTPRSGTSRRCRATTAPRSPPTRRPPPSPPATRSARSSTGSARSATGGASGRSRPRTSRPRSPRRPRRTSRAAHGSPRTCRSARTTAAIRRAPPSSPSAPAHWPSRRATRARSARPTTCSARSPPAAAPPPTRSTTCAAPWSWPRRPTTRAPASPPSTTSRSPTARAASSSPRSS